MRTKRVLVKDATQIEIGSIVIAQPFGQAEAYKRTVILILEHDQFGSTGVIINKLTTSYIQQAIPKIKMNEAIYYGGPIDANMISYIHCVPELFGSCDIGNGLFWGGNFETLQELIEVRKIFSSNIKYFAGFVEWAAGELEKEISEHRWWISDLTAEQFFGIDPENLWGTKLMMNGHVYGVLHEYPDPVMS